MKNKFLLIIFALLLVSQTGCDDYLEENLYSVLGEGSFPVESHVDPMINEAYSRAEYALLTHRRLHWAIEYTGPAFMYQVRANHERQSFAEWNWLNAWGNPAYYDLWDRCYKTVRSCNDVLALVPDVEMDETEKAEAIGAAQFLRGLVYYYMAQLWGGMPIIDKTQSLSDDLYPTRATLAATYEFIISDFKAAADMLPSRSQTVTDGRLGFPTKTAALGMLAKTYVVMSGSPLNDTGKLSDAKSTLEQVMNSGEHQLLPTFPEVFAWDNDNNEEFLYAMQLVGADGPQEYFYFYSWPREADVVFLDPETLEPTGEVGIMPPGQTGIKYDLIMPEFADWFK
ncbi:MAG: RagB/SusD family nutrient uptake outer membrane protein, partial [Bacteroidales bacterium]|nr:RagB/SusD family nutrient uptake outer membrane protein [Bacteroidales bacterium]